MEEVVLEALEEVDVDSATDRGAEAPELAAEHLRVDLKMSNFPT